MTDDEIVERLREGLMAGRIPRSMPVGKLGGLETIIVNGGRGRACSACGEVIGAAASGSIVYIYPDREIRFHGICQALWERERHAPVRSPVE